MKESMLQKIVGEEIAQKLHLTRLKLLSNLDGMPPSPLSLKDLITLHTEGAPDMSKVIVAVGYRNYVMDTRDAIVVAEALAKAEMYDTKYKSKEEGGTQVFVWEQGSEDSTITMSIISDSLYRMAKLAGRPNKD
jgi:hypothetical protein